MHARHVDSEVALGTSASLTGTPVTGEPLLKSSKGSATRRYSVNHQHHQNPAPAPLAPTPAAAAAAAEGAAAAPAAQDFQSAEGEML